MSLKEPADALSFCSRVIRGATQVVGLIGWPIEHSVSPPMHNAAFGSLGLDWCYVPFPVHPSRVKEAIQGMRALGIRGINVTVPHKQAVLSCVDQQTPAARAIGAVNTIIVKEEGLLGHNTDAQGFLRALGEAGLDVAAEAAATGLHALVLGAGGAARAVVYALISAGATVSILNRTEARAHRLAAEFRAVAEAVQQSADTERQKAAPVTGGPLNDDALRVDATRARLIVNATPLGMWPHVEATPWSDSVLFPSDVFCFDLVYNPRETRLMRQARAAGAKAADGLGMLVHQGAEAFQMWTGAEPPTDLMYAACTALLGGE